MAYRIDPAFPAGAEVRRVIAEQLDRASRELRGPHGTSADSVHDARKRIKKARSALRLGRADLGAHVVSHANAELRDVGASLSEQRDADALVEAADALTTNHPAAGLGQEAGDPTLARVRVALAARAAALRAHDGDGRLDRARVVRAARTLDQVAIWLVRVPSGRDGWGALGPGLARQHQRGRAAFDALGPEPTVEQLHELRKRVKDLWYHERLLRRLWPAVQAPFVLAAGDLADLLGQDHDLALLGQLLASPAPLAVDDPDRTHVAELTILRRSTLQDRIGGLGRRVYADTGEAWEQRHHRWWEAAVAGATA